MRPDTKPSSATKLPSITYRRLALAWALLIAVLCGIPGKQLPTNHWFDLFSVDKWVHAFLFFVLCYWLWRGYGKPHACGWNQTWPFWLASSAYGVLMEVLQATVFVDRSFDYQDMLANSSGATLAFVWIYWDKKATQPGRA